MLIKRVYRNDKFFNLIEILEYYKDNDKFYEVVIDYNDYIKKVKIDKECVKPIIDLMDFIKTRSQLVLYLNMFDILFSPIYRHEKEMLDKDKINGLIKCNVSVGTLK
ncbi:hypothetical protein [Pseudobacteroides cellulosolvens]|uniref:Uncharacterized protein n=1 Tax=Pseudobacteroides cellulosolvens ATCC 35603 = DSM 2933 TaxID=398512 RepID=A0A0L6JGZ0_9FIRM|nr:hypothetical protein [Pseudobacteroides cellulosolvens]KNY24989.1 hypothetical protein Bccel_0246 [Pseudobacteroides cellulosolvens ATCC 35603 = DSM 2933]